MANKVVLFTLLVEIEGQDPNPEDLDWFSMLEQSPKVVGFSLVNSELRPCNSMEDDPINRTLH